MLDAVSLLCPEHALLSHGQLVTHQGPKVLFCKAALQLVGLQHGPLPGVIPLQLQDFLLPFVELYDIHLRPILQTFEVPLDGSTTLWYISHSSLFCITSELAEDAICPSVQVINEEVK